MSAKLNSANVRTALVLAAIVGCDDGGSTLPDGGRITDAAPSGWATVSGLVLAEVDGDGPFPFEGATVEVVGLDPPIATTSASDGTFSVDVPAGVVMLRATATDHWGALGGGEVPEEGLTDLNLEITPDATIDDIAAGLGRLISPANGVVVVSFEEVSGAGGETATISASSDPPFIFHPSAGPIETNVLQPGSLPFVAFTNVPPGTTEVTVSGVAGTNTCMVVPGPAAIPAWRVEAKVITYAVAQCVAP